MLLLFKNCTSLAACTTPQIELNVKRLTDLEHRRPIWVSHSLCQLYIRSSVILTDSVYCPLFCLVRHSPSNPTDTIECRCSKFRGSAIYSVPVSCLGVHSCIILPITGKLMVCNYVISYCVYNMLWLTIKHCEL